MLIELGGGTNPHPRAMYVIDLHHPKNCPPQDATRPMWTAEPETRMHFANQCADEVYASHFLEHVPHGQPLINVMNEAWRVLRPGGTFMIILPLVGWTGIVHPVGWQPWADPTHVSYWWLPEALLYFCEGPFKANADYGIQTWAPLGDRIGEYEATLMIDNHHERVGPGLSFWAVREGWEGVACLVKP